MKEQKSLNKIKVLALFGPSGSGKDKIKQHLCREFNHYIHTVVGCTTRPARENEKDGVDYYFMSPSEFAEAVFDGSMVEASIFNDWGYGTTLDAFDKDKINIGIFNPSALECLLQDSRFEVEPVYIYASDKTRLIRCLNREKFPNCREICRRFLKDKEDFNDIAFDFEEYYNEDNSDLREARFLLSKWLNIDKLI